MADIGSSEISPPNSLAAPAPDPEDTSAAGTVPDSGSTDDRSLISAWAPRLLPALYLVASLSLSWPVLHDLGSAVPGGADGLLFAWHFEWVAQSVSHLHNPLVSYALNAPTGMNEMWNAAVLLLSVVCIPLTLTIGPFATVALLTVIAPAISGSACYAVLRRLTGRTIGAAIGGAVYAYGPFAIGQTAHLHVLFAPFPPLVVLLGHRLLVRQGGSPVRVGVALGVVTGLQLLVSEEIVALTAVGAAAGLFWLIVLNRREVAARAGYALHGAGIAVGVALLIASVPLLYQFFGPNSLKSFTAPLLRADVASLVRPSLLQHFASPADIRANLRFPANGSENTGYLGWPLIIAILAVCTWLIVRRERFGAWWLLTALSLVVLMFGTPISLNAKAIGRGPWAVVRKLPLFNGVIPARLSLLVLLMVAGLIALMLARSCGRRLLAGVTVTALVLVPLCPIAPLRGTKVPATPRFFATSAVNVIPAGSRTVVFPQAGFPRVDAMAWQTKAHMRFALVGGYSVFAEKGVATYFPPLPAFVSALQEVGRHGRINPDVLSQAASSVAPSGVRYIVITSIQRNSEAVTMAAAIVTGCTPRQVEDVQLCAVPTSP